MAKVKASKSNESSRPMRPALTPEAREGQLVFLATELAEKQLREGTASSQVIVHYLKLGTTNARLETARMEKELKLLDAKTEALESAKRMEDLYSEAIKAMRSYSGHGDSDED